jgi:hypothetical protein
MPLDPDDPWLTHVPLLHRILAGGEPVSAYQPVPRSDDIFEHCAYWEPLYYLLTSILGWTHLDRGLAWWYSNGKADHGDPQLAAMQQIWDSEHQLDFFAAWAWQEGREEFTLETAERTSAFLNAAWWREFRLRGRPYAHDPFHGGTNALHLGHSDHLGTTEEHRSARLHTELKTRTAFLIARDFATWREDLRTAGQTLPPLAHDRSWHVDVFDKKIGWLGTYRQSRVTGRWFAGKHSVHMAGQ